MTCDRCPNPAVVVANDLPDTFGGLNGDPIAGVLLCRSCLSVTEADGPWDAVNVLEAA